MDRNRRPWKQLIVPDTAEGLSNRLPLVYSEKLTRISCVVPVNLETADQQHTETAYGNDDII
jgi:hypothetical protein